MGAVLPLPPTPSSITLLRPGPPTTSFRLELKLGWRLEHCLAGLDIWSSLGCCHVWHVVSAALGLLGSNTQHPSDRPQPPAGTARARQGGHITHYRLQLEIHHTNYIPISLHHPPSQGTQTVSLSSHHHCWSVRLLPVHTPYKYDTLPPLQVNIGWQHSRFPPTVFQV